MYNTFYGIRLGNLFVKVSLLLLSSTTVSTFEVIIVLLCLLHVAIR